MLFVFERGTICSKLLYSLHYLKIMDKISPLLLLFLFSMCNSVGKSKFSRSPKIDVQEKHTIRIYRLATDLKYFNLKVNNNFTYVDSSGSVLPYAPGTLINEYRFSDSLVRFFVEIGAKDNINVRDTSFVVNGNAIDSVLIGIYGGGNKEGFIYVRTNRDFESWLTE